MEERCPICKSERHNDSKFCVKCGHKYNDNICPKCGNTVNAEIEFCTECGNKISKPEAFRVETANTIPTQESPGAQTEPPVIPIIQSPPPAVPIQAHQEQIPQAGIGQTPQMQIPDSQAIHGQQVKINQPLAYQAPKAPSYQAQVLYQVSQPYAGKPKKTNKNLIIAITVSIVLLVLASAAFFTRSLWLKPQTQAGPALTPTSAPSSAPTSVPTPEAGKKEVPPPEYSYESPSIIRPALYQSSDYVVYFKGSSEEEKELLLTVEIPGFTQKYEQKIILKPQQLKMKIRPPMIEGILKTLNISRESQLKVTLQDASTGKYLIQDSKPVTILSKYDMKWESDDGQETYYQNVCAWVTPESPKIKELLRNSIDRLSEWSNGAINAIVGYQPIGNLSAQEITYYQIAAIYDTLASYYEVRYNATPVSTSGSEAQQRIALPEDVINQRSGLCIETAVTMASAVEATGMHPMVLILPGHAQIAVETWYSSGEYLLMETTALTEPDWNNIIYYLSREQWSSYLSENEVTVVDVALARKDGIKPME